MEKHTDTTEKNSSWKKGALSLLFLLLLLSLSLGACALPDTENTVIVLSALGEEDVFRIDSITCSKAEFMLCLTNTQNLYEAAYGEGIWQTQSQGVTLEENVKETVLARLAQIKAVYLLAMSYGIVLDEAEMQALSLAADSYYASLSEEEIALLGISYETVYTLYEQMACADKVYAAIIAEVNPEISDDEARSISLQQIYFATDAATAAEVYKTAAEVVALAAAGSDFSALAAQYSDAEQVSLSLRRGQVEEVLEEAAFALETGEVSGLLEAGDGYYIFKCISTYDKEQTDANKAEILAERKQAAFLEVYEAFVEGLAKEVNEELYEALALVHEEAVCSDGFFRVYEVYFAGE